MANATVKALIMVALSGTILSGCSIFGSSASKDSKTVKAVSTSEVDTTTTKTVEIIETVALAGNQSYDIITVDRASFLLLNAEASLQDWRACESRSNGYWNFDDLNLAGALNPKFESCMTDIGYRLETKLSDKMLALLNSNWMSSSTQLASSMVDVDTEDMATKHASMKVGSGSHVDTTHTMTTMTETVVEVDNMTVMGGSTMIKPVTTSGTQSGDILETVRLSANKSYDIVTVDGALIIRLNGEASMTEWRACEVRTNGYWTFDDTSLYGSLKPEFENCMQGLDYTLETQLSDDLSEAVLATFDETVETVSSAELSMDVPEADELASDVQPSP